MSNHYRYLICSLNSEAMAIDESTLEVETNFRFQMEWDKQVNSIWESLFTSEQENITKPTFPYIESDIIEFITAIKTKKKQRSLWQKLQKGLSFPSKQKLSSHRKIRLLQQLQEKNHPLFLMKAIPNSDVLIGAEDSFTFAQQEERPRHLVTLTRPFAIGRYPVTQSLWKQVMKNNPSEFKGENRPVEQVNWVECVLFCNTLSALEGLRPVYSTPVGIERLFMQTGESNPAITDTEVDQMALQIKQDLDANGYRLPTEAEWEYAAKGVSARNNVRQNTVRFRYSGSDELNQVAWFRDNSRAKTQPAGQKEANSFGLYDMSGNVWEWVWDWYQEDYYKDSPARNPSGPKTGTAKINRGGSWRNGKESLHCSFRFRNSPSLRYDDLGFRLARTITMDEL